MQPPEIIKKLRKEIKMGQMSWLSHLIEHNKKEELEVFLAEKGFKDPKFAAKQIKKSPVGTPVSKVFKKLRTLGAVPPAPSADMGDPTLSGETIPKFSVIAPGGRAKEQTLGVRR